jgi:hypothetical protein
MFVNFISISSDWLHYHRREFTRSLAKEINEWGEVVVVEAPVSLTVNLFIKFKSRLLSLFKGDLRPRRIENGIMVITPVILFHIKLWERSSILSYIDSVLLKYQLQSFAKQNYLNHKTVFWFYHPQQYILAKSLKNSKIVYDYYDDHDHDYEGEILKKNFELNRKMVALADLTICLSKYTYRKFSEISKKVIYLKNGCSINLLSQQSEKKEFVYDYALNERKTIGYLGTIRNWIDFELVESVIREFPDVNVVMIGPTIRNVSAEIEKFRAYKNFTKIDFVHPDKIYDYIKSFSVGIIPFKVNNFTKSVFPNKFFEYAVCEIPVVTTALPELEEYKALSGFSATKVEFISNCREALNGNCDDKVKLNRQNAIENSWENRVMSLHKILSDKLGPK